MPSTTSNRPPMLMSCDWRQRLGLTVSGASASVVMKLYCCGFQIGLPDWPSIMAEGSGAIRPLRALSKSDGSSKGSACRNSAFAALVASVASLRKSCDWDEEGPPGVQQARPRMHRVNRKIGRASYRARGGQYA